MRIMQEEEFERLKFTCDPSNCDHSELVRLYEKGAHTDYACMKCGMCSGVREDFKKSKS